MTCRFKFSLLLMSLLVAVPAQAVTYNFDGTTDQTWQGANWDNGTPGQIAIESTGGDTGLAPTGNSYDYLADDFTIGNGTIVTSPSRVTLQDGSLTLNNGSQLDITSTGDNSALNIGFGGGTGTSLIFNSATANFAGAGTSGRAVRLENGSTWSITDSTVTVTSTGANNSIEVDSNSMITVTNSTINAGFIRLDEGTSGLDFVSGTLNLSSSNPLRSSDGFTGELNFSGAAGAASIVHSNLTDAANSLAVKLGNGLFSVGGTAVDSQLDVIGGNRLEITRSGGNDTLQVVSAANLTIWNVDADGSFGTAGNYTNGAPSLITDAAFDAGLLTADRTVSVDAPATVNKLIFDGLGAQFTIGGASTLTLADDGADTPVLQVNNGAATIAAPLAGSSLVTVNGGGDIVLSGANSGLTGGFAIEQGSLRTTNTAGLGSGAITIAENNFLYLDGDGLGTGYNGTFSNTVTGTGALRTGENATTEVVTLDGTALAGFDGTVGVRGGVTVANSNSSLGTTVGPTWINQEAGGTLHLDGTSGDLTFGETFNLGNRLTAAESHIVNVAGANTLTSNINGANGNNFHNIAVTGGSLTISNTSATPALVSDNNDNGTFAFDVSSGASVIIGDSADAGAGKITGGANVLKTGDGTMRIETSTAVAADFWTGTTDVQGGTMVIVAGASDSGELASSQINVGAGATLDVSSFSSTNGYSTQAISDPDQIPFNGDEVGQTISGSGTIVTSALGFNAFEDTVIAPGDNGAGTLSVTGNMTINQSQANPNGALNYELSNSAAGTNDQLAVSGNLNLLADGALGGGQFKLNIVPIDGQLDAGTYTLMTGTLGGTATSADFDIALVNQQGTALNSRQDDTSSVSINASDVTISFSAASALTWSATAGAGDGDWDTATTSNWNSDTEMFFDLDSVTFGDIAGGDGSNVVNIAAAVTPASITFANTTDSYTFTGQGIEGATGLTLAPGTTVTLANDNNAFTGDINVGTATLVIGDGSAVARNVLGDSNAVSIASGGTLNFNDGNGETLNGDIANDGAILQSGPGPINLTGVVSGTGSLTVNGGNATLSGNNTYTGLTTVTSGSLFLQQTDLASPLGDTSAGTVVDGGRLIANSQTGTISEQITLSNGGELGVGGGAVSAFTVASDVTIGTGGGLVDVDGGTGTDGLTIDGSLVGAVGGQLQVNTGGGSTANVTGSITNNGTLLKTGGGTLALTGAASTITSPTIDVQSGTLDVSAMNAGAGITLASGQTLNNDSNNTVIGDVTADSGSVVSGQGTFANNVTAQSGSILRVGDANGPAPTPTTLDSLFSNGSGTTYDRGSFRLDFGANQDLQAQTFTYSFTDAATGVTFTADLTATANSDNAGATNLQVTSTGGTGAAGVGGTSTGGGNGAIDFDNAGSQGGESLGFTVSNIQQTGGPAISGLAFDGFSEITLYFSDNPGDAGAVTDGTSDIWTFSGPLGTAGNSSDDNLYTFAAANTASTLDVSGTLPALVQYESRSGGDGSSNRIRIDDLAGQFSWLTPAQSVTMTIAGDLLMAAGSSLEIDLFSTSATDILDVTGILTAGGDLNVSLAAGAATPGLGDSYDILNFGSAAGAFDMVNLPALGSGLAWDTANLLTTGVIEVIAGGVPGDFDGDGFVGLSDLNILGSNFGTMGGATLATGDANGDGNVTLADLNILGSNWNPAPAVAVPEPSTLLLGLMAVAAFARKRS